MLGGRRHHRGRHHRRRSRYYSISSPTSPPKRSNISKAGSIFGTVAIYRSLIFSVVMVFICIGVLIFANLYHHNWEETEALILDGPNCHDTYNNKGNKTSKCNYKLRVTKGGLTRIEYLNNVDFQIPIIKNGKKYINIEYNKNNIGNINVPFKNIKKTLNWVFGVILVLSIINLIITYKFRNNRIMKGVKGIGLAQNIIAPNRGNSDGGFLDILFR